MMNLVKRYCIVLVLLGALDAGAYTSRYAQINVAGNFNGYNTTANPLSLISNNTWRGYLSLNAYTNPAFLFVTNGSFGTTWKVTNQPVQPFPVSGTTVTNASASNITLTGVISGTLMCVLDDVSGFYMADVLTGPWTSRFPYVNLAASFNSYNTTTPNMTLVTNGLWQSTVTFATAVTNPAFLFATRSFGTTWKETDQTWFEPWLSATAEQNSGSDMRISNVLSGTWQFQFNETTRAYSVEPVVTNAVAWTSRYDYVNLAGSFNGFDTQSTNMVMISNGVWQSYVILPTTVTNPYFSFATRDFAHTWKESNQGVFSLPLSGGVEVDTGSDISIVGTVRGILRFQFNERTGAYRVENVTPVGQPGEPWINEIHYDHVGTDTNEFIEVAGPAGVNLSSYAMVLYNGNGGVTYRTQALAGVISDQLNGYGTIVFPFNNVLENGSPDGVALVKDVTNVLEFLSYEGVMTAVSGPAAGMTSVDIGVQESNVGSVTTSLQRVGQGAVGTDFTWVGPSNGSPGAVNASQITTTGPAPALVLFTNLVTVPPTPSTGDAVYVEVDISPNLLASNLFATTFYRLNSNGLYLALSMSRTGTHFRTYRPIPAQPAGTLVEYYAFVSYAGSGTNSPQWFPTNAPTAVQTYGVGRVMYGSVWINEFDPGCPFNPSQEFIELVGLAGQDATGWQVLLYDYSTNLFAQYVLSSGTIFPNEYLGFGFYVFGSPSIANVDRTFSVYTNEYFPDSGGIELRNEFGAVQQSLWYGNITPPPGATNIYDTASDGAVYNDYESAAFSGSGGSLGAFIWTTNDLSSPGTTNVGQVLIGGNTNDLPPIIVCPSNLYFTCLTSPVPTVNVASVTATGLCAGGAVTVTHAGDVTNSGSGCAGSPKIITRTYRAVSACATTSTCDQLIVFEDSAAPVLTLLGGTQALVNAGFESGSTFGWTTYGALSNQVSATVLAPHLGFAHGRIDDPASAYAADASGEGNDGFIVGAPQRGWSSRGQLGRAFGFDGVDDRIDIPYKADLNNSTTFSFSVWVKPSAGTGTVRAALGSLTNRGYSLVLGSNNFWRFVTGTNSHEMMGPKATNTIWAHMVGVFSNGVKQLYVSGALYGTTNGVSYAANTSAVLRIAGQVTANGGATNLFSGTVDDVQIFSRALSAAEVTTLYNGGQGGPAGALVEAHLKLNEPTNAVGVEASLYQSLPASSGQTWSVSGYLMNPGSLPLRESNRTVIVLQYLNADTAVVQAVTSQAVSVRTTTNTYVRYTASTVASANVASVRAMVRYIRDSDAAGSVYFDSFTLSRFAFDPGSNCTYVLPDLRVNVSASDGCSVVSTAQTPAVGASLAMGESDVVISALDQCGQSGSITIQVSVVDSTAPVLTATNLTVTCDNQLTATTGVTVVDCSPVTVTLLSDIVSGGNGCSTATARKTTRVLQAVDDAGFVAYATQVVSQVTTTAPSVSVANTGALANASFETGTGLTNWVRFGAAFSSADSARTGTRSVKLAGQYAGGVNYNGIYQDLPASSGQFWRASGWMRTPAVDPLSPGNEVTLKMEFLDASAIVGTVISRAFSVDEARDVYQPFSAQGVAPEGTERVRMVVIYVQVTNATGLVYADDLALNMTSLTSSNGTGTLPDMTQLVVSTNACSTPTISQLPVAGSVVTAGVTNITFVALDECGRSSTARVALVVGDEVVQSSVPTAPSNVVVQVFTMAGTNITLRSTGTNSWSVVAEYSTNLMGPLWQLISNSVNSYSGGTNVTSFGHPVTNAGQGIIFRVRQTYP